MGMSDITCKITGALTKTASVQRQFMIRHESIGRVQLPGMQRGKPRGYVIPEAINASTYKSQACEVGCVVLITYSHVHVEGGI